MAFAYKDRVKETTTTTGTGTITLAGAVTGFRAFSAAFSTPDTMYYVIDGGTGEWEVGLGTLATSTTLARTTVLSSSNSGSAVNFSAGTKNVWCDLPASAIPIIGGSSGQVQYNNSGSFGGVTGITLATGTLSALAVTGGTVTSSTPVLDATQTWNNSGVTFTGWKLNVTDTASASASLLMDLQKAGTSQLSVSKSGRVIAAAGGAAVSGFYVGGSAENGIYSPNATQMYLYGGNTAVAQATATGLGISSTSLLYFGSLGSAGDLFLARDAANTLALRNSTSAQTFNIYSSYTDGSNYSRLAITGNSITSQIAGTGSYTVTASAPVLNLAQSWNNAGVTFTGIKFNVPSDTSASASLLMDLQVGGSSKLSIKKDGLITGDGASPTLSLSQANGSILSYGSVSVIAGGTRTAFSISGNEYLRVDTATVTTGSGVSFGWSSSTGAGASQDTSIRRAAAANVQFGAADAASPVAQTISFQNVAAGTSNTAGANATFNASRGTGSGTPGDFIFKTAGKGAAATTQNTLITALTIKGGTTNNTDVGYPSVVQGSGAALNTTATDGFMHIASCAGAPTGVPTLYTGAIPMVFDTTNSKLMAYIGGAWKGVTLA